MTVTWQGLRQILWEQVRAEQRLFLLALLIAGAIVVLMAWGPYDAFSAELAAIATPQMHSAESLIWTNSQFIRWFTALCAAATLLAGLAGSRRAVAVPFALCWLGFACLAGAAARLTPAVWSYNSQLVIFGAMISAAWLIRRHLSCVAAAQTASFVLGFAQLYVGFFYLQSATSKFISTGGNWFWSGRTAWVYANEFGTTLGTTLASFPALFSVLSVAVGLFEALFLVVFVHWTSARSWLPAAAVMMHLSFWAVLDIGFWHLWALYPAVFVLRRPRSALDRHEPHEPQDHDARKSPVTSHHNEEGSPLATSK